MFTATNKTKIIIFQCLAIVLIMIPKSPLITRTMSDDTGVFIYSAWRILQGDVLYRQIWDHKPPLIYFINVLALILDHQGQWGLWSLQLVNFLVTYLIAFEVLFLTFGLIPATIASFMWILSPSILLGEGNYTQNYALFYQFALFYLFLIRERKNNKSLYSFFMGICGGILLALQSNLVALYISCFIFDLIRTYFHKKFYFQIAANLLGLLIIPVYLWIYFYSTQSIHEFYDAVIVYNSKYIYITYSLILLTIYTGILVNLLNGLTFSALTGYLMALKKLFFNKKNYLPNIIRIAIISLPLELLLSSASGRYYLHYFISWIPIFSVLSAFFIKTLVDKFRIFKKKIIIVFASFLIITPPLYTYADYLRTQTTRDKQVYNLQKQIIDFINQNTSENETVLLWGIEPRINFLTQRKSSSRFVYQYALFSKNYTNQKIVNDFISDLQTNKPKYIIESPIESTFMPSLNKEKRTKWTSSIAMYGTTAETEAIFKYIDTHYKHVQDIKTWSIYKRIY